jgi:hypothetical protein
MVWILHLPNGPSIPLKQRGYFVFAHEERHKNCDIIEWFLGYSIILIVWIITLAIILV